MALVSVGDAYSATGAAWQRGPARIYDHMAEVLVAASPIPLAGCLVLDRRPPAPTGEPEVLVRRVVVLTARV